MNDLHLITVLFFLLVGPCMWAGEKIGEALKKRFAK